MKNTFFSLLLISLSLSVSAQTQAKITTEAIALGKSKGQFEFVVPNTVTEELVAQAAGYYTEYFAVKFDKKKNVVTIHLTKQEEMNKRVIQRFLMTLNLDNVAVNDKLVRVDELYEMHLKSESATK